MMKILVIIMNTYQLTDAAYPGVVLYWSCAATTRVECIREKYICNRSQLISDIFNTVIKQKSTTPQLPLAQPKPPVICTISMYHSLILDSILWNLYLSLS